eukprot:scaffold114717_cov32-Tisochrysis_lutea.AAC.1
MQAERPQMHAPDRAGLRNGLRALMDAQFAGLVVRSEGLRLRPSPAHVEPPHPCSKDGHTQPKRGIPVDQ